MREGGRIVFASPAQLGEESLEEISYRLGRRKRCRGASARSRRKVANERVVQGKT